MRFARHVALALLASVLVGCATQSQPPAPSPSPEPATVTVVATVASSATAEASPSAAVSVAPQIDTPPPSPGATVPPAASPTPATTPTPAPERVQVFGSGNQFVNMRREPGTDSPVLKSVRDGTEVIVVGTDRESDGRIWRNVQDGDAVGWIVATALRSFPTPTVTPSLTATSEATATTAATASSTATRTPSASPTSAEPTATATPEAEPERVEVVGTGGVGANLRAEPSTDAPIVQNLLDGTRLTVIGEDREEDGRVWRNVRGDGGAEGWMVADVLRSLTLPTPAPTTASASRPQPPEDEGESEPTATPEGALEPAAEPTPAPERVEVYGTAPQGANLRAQPGRSGSVLQSVPDGAVLTIVGEDRTVDGVLWRNVQTEDGATGWLALEVIRTLVIPTPTPRPGAPGIGAPIEATPAPAEQLSEAERAARPCRPGQVKGDAATGFYYSADDPEYPELLQRVRCFDDVNRARASGFRAPEVIEPEPSAEPDPE